MDESDPREARSRGRRSSADLRVLGSIRFGAPEGVPETFWARLCLFGGWAAAVGDPLSRLSRPVELDDRGVLTIVAASARWSREILAHEQILTQRLSERSGQIVARLQVRVDETAFGGSPSR